MKYLLWYCNIVFTHFHCIFPNINILAGFLHWPDIRRLTYKHHFTTKKNIRSLPHSIIQIIHFNRSIYYCHAFTFDNIIKIVHQRIKRRVKCQTVSIIISHHSKGVEWSFTGCTRHTLTRINTLPYTMCVTKASRGIVITSEHQR